MPYFTVNRERFDHNGEILTLGQSVELTPERAAPYLVSAALLPAPDDFMPTEPTQGVVDVTETNQASPSDAATDAPPASDTDADGDKEVAVTKASATGGGESPAAAPVKAARGKRPR